jgi:hypothetical protein
LDQLQVTISIPYSNVQLVPLGIPANTTLTSQAVWYSNQDQAYPATVTPPSGS